MTNSNRELAACFAEEFKWMLNDDWHTFIVPDVWHRLLRRCAILSFEYKRIKVAFRLAIASTDVVLEPNVRCWRPGSEDGIVIPVWSGYRLSDNAIVYEGAWYPPFSYSGGRYDVSMVNDLMNPVAIDALAGEVMRAILHVQEAS